MMGGREGNAPLVVDVIDFQVPCRRFTIKASVTRDRQMPVVDEFVLRLVHVVQRISAARLAGYFGFSSAETEAVLVELIGRGLVESDASEIYLSPKGQSLFKGVSEGELPRLAIIESWTEGVWFDLVSRNIMTPERFRSLPHLVPLREQPGARQIPEAYARGAFERNFYDYALRVRRHPDADQLAIYSVSDVEAGIYGYQPVFAECLLDPASRSSESRLRLPVADRDPARLAPLSMAAADAWALLSGPDPSASGLDEYERLTGDKRPAALARAAQWTWFDDTVSEGVETRPFVGATYLDHNIERFCAVVSAALGGQRPAVSPNILWLRPGGTAWGRTFKVGDALQRVRDTLRSSGIRETETVVLVPRAVPAGHRRQLKRVFDEGRLAPSGTYPADIEVLLVPGLAAMIALHVAAGRHGTAVGVVSRDERLLRTLERRVGDTMLGTAQPLWAAAADA